LYEKNQTKLFLKVFFLFLKNVTQKKRIFKNPNPDNQPYKVFKMVVYNK